jgi:hypothetical protein
MPDPRDLLAGMIVFLFVSFVLLVVYLFILIYKYMMQVLRIQSRFNTDNECTNVPEHLPEQVAMHDNKKPKKENLNQIKVNI